jgi:acetylornithine deacetylase/succinyl-diaminopimelate desuccinylase-like protein
VAGIKHPYLNVGRIEGRNEYECGARQGDVQAGSPHDPEENPVEVEAAIRKTIADAAASYPGITVEIKRLLLANSMKPLPGNKPLVDAIQKHGKAVFGERSKQWERRFTPTCASMRSRHPGVIYGAGPRTVLESNAKRADENLVLEDLRKATKVVARTLRDLLA